MGLLESILKKVNEPQTVKWLDRSLGLPSIGRETLMHYFALLHLGFDHSMLDLFCDKDGSSGVVINCAKPLKLELAHLDGENLAEFPIFVKGLIQKVQTWTSDDFRREFHHSEAFKRTGDLIEMLLDYGFVLTPNKVSWFDGKVI